MYQYATLGSTDLARSRAFFAPVLGALGIEAFHDSEHGLAYAKKGTKLPSLWVIEPFAGGAATGGNGTMLAFDAASAAEVDAFHAAALANGGSDEGAPGYREHYAPFFYAAYVRDPFGNKLCAVFRDPAKGAS
jgi:catechol 2,3-dioxygenase-like lactoylglutathione lyase family enzyme